MASVSSMATSPAAEVEMSAMATVVSMAPALPTPVAASMTTVPLFAVMSVSMSPPSMTPPATAVTVTAVLVALVVVRALSVMSASASMSIGAEPASITAPLAMTTFAVVPAVSASRVTVPVLVVILLPAAISRSPPSEATLTVPSTLVIGASR